MQDVSNLKRRCEHLALGLSQRLTALEVSSFSSKSAYHLIQLLRTILDEVSLQVSSLENKKSLLLCCVLLEDFGYFLSFLESASSEHAPQALIIMLESMSAEIRPHEMLIAAPDPEFNYRIVDILPLIRERTVNLFPPEVQQEVYSGCPRSINIVLFPRTARDDVLMHAMFAHELGHAIADDFLSAEESSTPSLYSDGLAQATTKIEELIRKEMYDLTPLEELAEKQERLSEVIEVRKRGLQEVISDCVGALLLGPSAIFALRDFLISEPIDLLPDSPEYYPCARFRLRHTFATLQTSGFLEVLSDLRVSDSISSTINEHVDEVRELVESMEDVEMLRTDSMLRIAYDWLDETLNSAIEYAKSAVGKGIYRAEVLGDEVPELLDRLALSLPPNEIGKPPDQRPVDWRSALAAAWIFVLSSDSLRSEEDSRKKIEELQRLALAAIDYIHIQNQYEKAVGKGA